MCIGNCFIKTVYTCGIHFRILCFTCWATRSSWCRTEHDGAALSPRCCWRSDTCPRQIPTLPSHQQPQLGSRFQTAGLGGCWITHTHFIFPVNIVSLCMWFIYRCLQKSQKMLKLLTLLTIEKEDIQWHGPTSAHPSKIQWKHNTARFFKIWKSPYAKRENVPWCLN